MNMRFVQKASLLILLASTAQAQVFSEAQMKLYNRLPDADWYVLDLTDREMLSVSLKRLPAKDEDSYRDVWLRWDVIDHPADEGRSSGLIVDIDCKSRQTFEKRQLGLNETTKRETVVEINKVRDWIPGSPAEKAYETFCTGFDAAVEEWKKRPAPAKPAVE